MKKVILFTLLIAGLYSKAQSQTTIHGSSEPVTLYDLTNGSFFKVITTDIWMYANGNVGIAMPYTLQAVTPPTINGTPMIDFRPMSCYDAKSAWGQTAVKCGPYNVEIVDNSTIKTCGDTDNTTCRVEWTDEKGKHVIYNVQIP